ncbi:MAG: ATP-grasp domain-containing protein [Promethearchaeota archaeon]
MKKILVTGAGGPAGINFLRSLHNIEEKMELFGTDINVYHKQFAKPWTKETFLVPRADSPNYIEKINEIVENFKIEFIHPQPDVEVAAISENREKINAITYLPKKETIRIMQDKFKSASIWKNSGFPSVRAIEIKPNRLEKDIEKALSELGEKIWIRAKRGAGGTGSTPVENVETGVCWIKYWLSRGKKWEFIAQEYLPGRNIAFQSIFKEGELITSQARERIEYIYPYLAPSGVTGTPIVAKTINDDKVNKIATEAVLSIDSEATGVFCVDIKEDKEGNPCPTEINAGRFFTTSYFFSLASKKFNIPLANMPYILVKLAYGETIPEGPKYNILPENLYYLRHIDCSEHLIEGKNLK